MSEPVRIDLAECRCAGTPHHHDWVDLAPDPTIPMGAASMSAIRKVGNDPVLLEGELARIYLTYGITAWSFVDDEGHPVRVDSAGADWPATIERWLPWWEGGFDVANEADRLYAGRILRPLMNRQSRRSQGGRTVGSTSPTPPSGSTRPTPRRRSSRTATGGRRSGA